MGASGWTYFVPYQLDINKALQELRQREFEAGAYYRPLEIHLGLEEYGSLSEEALTARIEAAKKAEPRPPTIQDLLKANGEGGTHSIIDIEEISDVPDFGKAAQFTYQELLQLFNTDKPTHNMIEKSREMLEGFRRRWEGIYIVVYKDDRPDEIFFAGHSGD